MLESFKVRINKHTLLSLRQLISAVIQNLPAYDNEHELNLILYKHPDTGLNIVFTDDSKPEPKIGSMGWGITDDNGDYCEQ